MSFNSVCIPSLTVEEQSKIDTELNELFQHPLNCKPKKENSDLERFVSHEIDSLFEDFTGEIKKECENKGDAGTTFSLPCVINAHRNNILNDGDGDDTPDMVCCDSSDDEDNCMDEWSEYNELNENMKEGEDVDLFENMVEGDETTTAVGSDHEKECCEEKNIYQLSEGVFVPGMVYDSKPCDNCSTLQRSLEERKKNSEENASSHRSDNYLMNKAVNINVHSELKVSDIEVVKSFIVVSL